MGLFDRASSTSKPPRRDVEDRYKDVGAREYEARRRIRAAERFEAIGDTVAAQAERDAAAELRRRPVARR